VGDPTHGRAGATLKNGQKVVFDIATRKIISIAEQQAPVSEKVGGISDKTPPPTKPIEQLSRAEFDQEAKLVKAQIGEPVKSAIALLEKLVRHPADEVLRKQVEQLAASNPRALSLAADSPALAHVEAGIHAPPEMVRNKKKADVGSFINSLLVSKNAADFLDPRVHAARIRQSAILLEDKAQQHSFNAEAADAYGIKPPAGYVREGDLYIYKPETKPAEVPAVNEVIETALQNGYRTEKAFTKDFEKNSLKKYNENQEEFLKRRVCSETVPVKRKVLAND
jgi:hypothetical protein